MINRDRDNSVNLPKRRRPNLLGATAAATAALAAGTMVPKADASPHAVDARPAVTKTAEIQKLQHKLKAEEVELSRVSNIASKMIGIPKSQLEGNGLVDPEPQIELGKKVSPEIKENVAQSTLELLVRNVNSGGGYEPVCTATNVLYKGKDYVRTARHCITEAQVLDLDDTLGYPSQNITKQLNLTQWAVGVPGSNVPIAYLENIAISSTGYGDGALLQVDTIPTKGGPSVVSFDSIPALEYKATKAQPVPYEQVAMYGDSDVNHDKPRATTGTYLGQTYMKDNNTNGTNGDVPMYVVGITAEDLRQSGCAPGDSGSAAESASGFVFGALWGTNNITPSDPFSDAGMAEKFRITTLEKELGIKLDRFSQLCFYSADQIDTSGQSVTMQQLVQGLDLEPPNPYGTPTEPPQPSVNPVVPTTTSTTPTN